MSFDPTDDDQNKQLMNFLQSGGPSTPPAGGGIPPPPPTDIAPIANVPHGTNDTDPATKVADSHPGLQPGDLPSYVQGQEKQVDKYGPDQQKAVMDMIAQQQGGLREGIGRRMTGLGDDLIQISGKGNPGHLANYTERENQVANRAANVGKDLNTQNLEGLKTKEGLEGLTSTSPLGASESKPAMFLAKQLWPNIPPKVLQSIGQNPRALSGILGPGVDLNKALAEIQSTAAYRQAEIGMQKATLENTASNQKTQAGIAEQARQTEAQRMQTEKDKAIANGSPIPFVGPSHAEKQSALGRLSSGPGGAPQGASGPTPVNSQAEYDALPSGTHYVDSHGTQKVKK